jgi:F-type H+-transporting ATPase subunit b
MRIDWWTLALQTVNVLVLVWILGRYFFRPVMAIVGKRQEEAAKLLSDAEAERRSAAAARADADKVRAEIDGQRRQLIAEALDAAKAEKAKALEQSAREIAHLHDEAQAAIGRDRAQAEGAIVAHAGELSVDMASRLLSRLSPRTPLQAFVEGVCRQAQDLPASTREEFKPSSTAAERPTVVTASALSADDQRYVCDRLGQALGFEPVFVFRVDDALLAGLEVRGRSVVLRDTWRADLDRIHEELSRDGRSKPA